MATAVVGDGPMILFDWVLLEEEEEVLDPGGPIGLPVLYELTSGPIVALPGLLVVRFSLAIASATLGSRVV